MNLERRHARIGVVALLVLASCFRGPVSPTVTLAPAAPDAPEGRTRSPFAVVYAAPKGRVVDRKSGVTVMFSRGVRSVDMSDDERVPAVSIKTKSGAPVKGSWRWTGTRGLLFSPDDELPGGSDFVVTVPGDVTALDGSVLGKPYTLELSTDGPSVRSVKVLGPAGVTEHAMPRDAAFRVEFDQSVEPSAVEAAAKLRAFAADGDRGEIIRVVASREAAPPSPPSTSSAPPPRVPASYVVVLKPEKPLPLDRQIELTIDKSLRGTGGPRPMKETFTKTMRTHGPLRFVDFYCPRIEPKGRCRQKGDVKVVMSNPVTPDELKAHVRLGKLPRRQPKPGAATPPRRIDPSVEHWLGVEPKLGESYSVTLTAGMRDIYGQKLEKDVSFDIVVEAPLVRAPAAPLAQQPKPPTAPKPPVANPTYIDSRPRRERLPYLLDLGLTGQVLEANGSHKIPVGAVNVPTYATLAAPLTEAQATSWTLARGTTTDFLTRNGLVPTWKTVQAPQNTRVVDFIDLDAALAPRKGRGPALLVLTPPGAMTSPYGRTESLVTVTDLGVTAKMSPFGGLVWVTRLSTGKPVSGASVTIRTAKDSTGPRDVFEGTTDSQGLVIVPADKFDPIAKAATPSWGDEDSGAGGRVRDDAAIVVRSGDDWTITKIQKSDVETRLASDFQLLSTEGRWAGMLFADRGVFRPGETAKVAGIVRVVEAGGTRTVPGRELRIQLMDRNEEQIFDGRAKCDDFGTFSLDLPIPRTAPIGTATIVATALPGGKSNTTRSGVFRHEIRLLEYKPNEFKVTVEADKPFYVRGDTATFSVQGDYLYGAPMQGATVTTTVSRQEVPFTPPNVEGFTVTDDVFTDDYPDEPPSAEQIDSQDGELDARGRFERKVPLSFDDQRRPERVLFDADVQDLSRNDVSARTSVLVHPGEFYVALRRPKDRFVTVGAPLRAEVAAVDPNGVRRAGVKVKVELVERRWTSITGEQPDGRTLRSSKAQDTVVAQCDATTTTTTGACELRLPRAGFFVLRATASDPRNNTVRASTAVYGTEDSPKAAPAWPADNRHAIKLETNKKTYEVGETAKVALQSPFKEGHALVTVERNGVLWRNVVPIAGPLPVVEVPVRPEMYPNAWVSVVAIRGRVQAPPAVGADLGGPDFRFGWAEIDVNKDAHRLDVSISAPKSEYQPGSTVEADVVVKDRAGRPVETALTFYVVDEGVLALTSYTTPDPLPAFVRRRKLRTFTLDNREKLARILPLKAGERLPSLGFEYHLSSAHDAYDKGDDGGDGSGTKRANFRTTAHFEAGRKTDKSGRARFKFKLPDNLTTFRLMAVAAAADDRFGSGDSKITTNRRLMARPALPRLLRVGDSLEASVIVSSKADEKTPSGTMQVTVKLDAKGVALAGPNTRTITMPRGGQAEVRFPVKATAPGDAVLTFDVRSGADVDKVEVKRRVELPVSVESTVAYGETAGDAAVALGDLTAIRRDYGGLDVRVASSALVGLGMTIDHLTDYPYGCTEQVTSKILPLVAMTELVKASNARVSKDVTSTIDAGVETLLKRQAGDGGFGFWDTTESEPWLSAYAMLALAGAAEKKRLVPKDALDRGREYLTHELANAARRLSRPAPESSEYREDRVDGLTPAEAREKDETTRKIDYAGAALIADTLAVLGAPNPGAINVLYDARAGQRLSAQAALLHAMATAGMSQAQIKSLMQEIESRLRVGPEGIDVDEAESNRYDVLLESPTRTHAMVLRALLAANPKHPLAPRLARRLLALRQPNGAWHTTQEDAWALLALADYRRLQESGQGPLEVTTSLGGKELLASKFPAGTLGEDRVFVSAETLLARGPTLSFEARGGGTAYWSAQLKYATAALPAKPRDEGLFVTKYVRSVPATAVADALPIVPKRTADAVTAGELVIVDLLFESAEPRVHVVLDDPLPAGLEALDYDLDTTSKAFRDAESKKPDPKTTWLGTTFRRAKSRREVRDDRVVTTFDEIEPGMYRVRYLARATSIGTFVVPPTRIEAMYEPEVYGRTAATTLAVRPKQ